MKTRIAVAWVLAAAAGALPGLCGAENVRLGEVVVTAQKREEALKDVPMSVTAIEGRDLELRSLDSIQDIGFAVPGMAMREDGPGSYTIFMRGLSNQYGTDALVGLYLDEAPVTISGYDQMDVRVMDFERLEVLRGPQGTLYGQGALAGVVRYITKKPRLDGIEGRLEATGSWVSGGDSREELQGVINLPIVRDKFGIRIAGLVGQGGGWQDQPQAGIKNGNGQDLDEVRLSALWKVTDSFTVELLGQTHSNHVRLGLGYENPDRTITVGIDRSRVLLPKDFDYDLGNMTLRFDFGGVELMSSSTYIDHDHQYPFSYIGGPETVYGGDLEGTDDRWGHGEMFTQELRLTSAAGGRAHWTVGAFYRHASSDLKAVYDTLFFGIEYPDAVYFNEDRWDSTSIYGDLAFDVTDRLQVGAGVRYFEDDQENFDGANTYKDSFDSTDPRFYVSYALSDDVRIYANASKGFRSGGFNYAGAPGYEPESLWSYEVGAKGVVADGRFSFDVAAYMTDYDDMLRRGLVFDTNTNQFISITSNIGKVEVQGIEGSINWAATDVFTLYATAAFIDSEIKEVNATDATSLPGDRVDYVPRTSFTVGGVFTFNWAANVDGFARLDYSYRDKVEYTDRTTFPADNVPQLSDDIGLVDARLGAKFGKWNVELFGTNLTDENKWIDPYHAWTNANRTRPRTIGIQVGIDFD